MSAPFRAVLRCAALFAAAAGVMLALLLGAAAIPREAIRERLRTSAEYLAARPVFFLALPGVEGSRIDRYADSILLGIAWQYDREALLPSVMQSAYYYTPYQNENDNLLEAVERDLAANQQYLRYWHGSNALVRPLLTVLSLREIYLLGGLALGLLALALVLTLLRGRAFWAAGGVIAGMGAACFWWAPLSLEYTWVCLLCLGFSLLVLRCERRGRRDRLPGLFLLSGLATSFLDFLTCETLTLLIPLLLLVRLQSEDARANPRRAALGAALAWCCGYGGMWALKWLLASLVLGQNVLPYVTGHVEERVAGALPWVRPGAALPGAILLNLLCLFPIGWGGGGLLAGLALILGALYRGYVYRRPGWNRSLTAVYCALGLVPYVRYLVLHNHSLLHCFFTYRAQMATVLAAALILEELTERRGRHDAGGQRAP